MHGRPVQILIIDDEQELDAAEAVRGLVSITNRKRVHEIIEALADPNLPVAMGPDVMLVDINMYKADGPEREREGDPEMWPMDGSIARRLYGPMLALPFAAAGRKPRAVLLYTASRAQVANDGLAALSLSLLLTVAHGEEVSFADVIEWARGDNSGFSGDVWEKRPEHSSADILAFALKCYREQLLKYGGSEFAVVDTAGVVLRPESIAESLAIAPENYAVHLFPADRDPISVRALFADVEPDAFAGTASAWLTEGTRYRTTLPGEDIESAKAAADDLFRGRRPPNWPPGKKCTLVARSAIAFRRTKGDAWATPAELAWRRLVRALVWSAIHAKQESNGLFQELITDSPPDDERERNLGRLYAQQVAQQRAFHPDLSGKTPPHNLQNRKSTGPDDGLEPWERAACREFLKQLNIKADKFPPCVTDAI